MKKRNPQDATLRNVRAAHTAIAKLTKRIHKIEMIIGVMIGPERAEYEFYRRKRKS